MQSRPDPAQAPAFREAIAQWQLAARTAVKRSSSLPSSVFDACDPMLEARLAQSVQQLMEQLQQPQQLAGDATAELRREIVEPREMSQLRRLVAGGSAEVDLHAGQVAELLGVLLDTLVTASTPAKHAALQVLREQFGISEQTDLDAAARALTEVVDRSTSGNPAQLDEQVETMIAGLCGQIAGAALVQSRRPDATAGSPGPEGAA